MTFQQKTIQKKTETCIANENGSAIIFVLLVMVILSIIAFQANRSTTTESMIIRNVLEGHRDFYITENAQYEVADLVNKGSGFAVTDLDTETIYADSTLSDGTTIQTGPVDETDVSASEWDHILDNFTDEAWPTTNDGTGGEYAYRAHYKGYGENPKGYGKGFTTFLFEVTTRKQLTQGGAVVERTVIINKGHRKVGPKVSSS